MERIRRRTYSVEEAAKILGISRSLAYESVKTGEIEAIRIGGRIVIPERVIDELTGDIKPPTPDSIGLWDITG